MRVLWITSLPAQVEVEALGGINHGSQHPASWIIGHLPAPKDVELHVACLWPGGWREKSFEYCGATFHLVPCPVGGRALTLHVFDHIYMRGLYRRLQPDVVHGWGTDSANGCIALRLDARRHVIGLQGIQSEINQHRSFNLRNAITAWVERGVLRCAQHLVAESHYAAQLAFRYGARANPRRVQHPLRAEFLQCDPGGGDRRCEVVFLGRLVEQKGIGDALSAFAVAAPQKWSLRLIGGASTIDAAAVLKQVHYLGLAKRCTMEADLSPQELVQRLHDAAILLLPTKIDSGPTSLKEALCMGVWPLCYDNSGPSEWIRHFNYGQLVPDRDRGVLTRMLREAIAISPWRDDLRREHCIEIARECFSPQTAWRGLLEVYREVCGESVSAA